MAKLGFVGLGIMGAPMAQHLIKAGHEVSLWSHNAEKVKRLAAEYGGKACATPAEVAQGASVVFVCVGDSEMSRDVILGADGIAKGAEKGLIVVDCSTISPKVSRATAASLQGQGIRMLDAPCTGSKAGAEGGTLTFMVGGDKAVFEEVRPLFESMGKMLYYCGGPGVGLNAKLTQNLILGNLLQAFNEGLVLSAKAGVDSGMMIEILNNSAAKSGLISAKAPQVMARNFSTNFSLKWLSKDIGLALDSAQELGVPLTITPATQKVYQAAIAEGFGEEDMCGSIRLLEKQAGVELPIKSA